MYDSRNPLFFKGFFDLGWCGERELWQKLGDILWIMSGVRNYAEKWGEIRLFRE